MRRLAGLAASVGYETSLPDLTSVASSGQPHDDFIRLATGAINETRATPVVVAHSGAGVYLPSILGRLDGAVGLLFVDAVVPPVQGRHRTSERLSSMLDEQAVDGLLRRWLDWWAPEVVEGLLPNAADREELLADMPRLRRSFYDSDVAVPVDWSNGPFGYLRLSAAYDGDLAEARARTWPTSTLDATHLSVHTEPEAVFEKILDLTERIASKHRV